MSNLKPAYLRALRLLCLMLFPALASSFVYAGTALDQFQSFVSSTKSAKGTFSQRQLKTVEDETVLSQPASGHFVFAKPGRFIWTYTQPYEQILQADGKHIYIYDKDMNQVTIRKLNRSLNSNPAAILFGDKDVSKSFAITETGTRNGVAWLEAIPKSDETGFEKIGIGMQNGLPVAMELHDAFGQISVLTFHRFQQNPPVDKSQFKFVIPKGADVFRQ